jgi:superfamily II DNA or RNA helicase
MTTKKCYIRVKDEVYCTLSGLQPSDIEFLWEKYGIFVEGYFHMPQYKLGRWDGKIRFFEKTGKTYIRLLDEILPFLEKWGYEIELKDERIPIKTFPEFIKHDNFIKYGIELRPYQVESINVALSESNGFIIVGTGGGKSLICAGICDAYGKVGYKTITIVPSSDLVSQTADWYKLCGMDVGEYSGVNKELNKQHVVGTWQAIQNNPHLMKQFQVFIWDEAQGVKASVAQKLICDYGKHIPFRFGCTGTFPKPKADVISLKVAIGSIIKEIPARWLIDNGYLAEIEIECIRTKDTVFTDGDFPDYKSERSYICRSPKRMDYIADLIISKCEQYGNTLVLVNSIKFGEQLQKMIKDTVFLYGISEKSERKLHYDAFEEKDNVIVIASSGIASTGISIDRVFCLIMIDAGKSFIKAIQACGRGLRKAKDKNKVHVVDIGADLRWSRKHMNERIKYYKEANYNCSKPITVKIK